MSRRLVVLALGAGFFLSAVPATELPSRRSASPQPLAVPERGPDDWLLAQRADAQGRIPPFAYEKAVADAVALRRETAAASPALPQWNLEGPNGVGGRVVDIVVDVDDPATVYVAAATGGVWKSTDGGTTFAPAWSDRMTQSMGALAVGSDGTLWAGTGEANPGGGSIVYGGSGVYRSTDDGETWKRVGLKRSGAIGRIVVDPTNPKRVWVAAAGPLYEPGGQRGVYVTTDGGNRWQRALKGANATTGAVDLALDPQNPQRVFAALWDHVRYPDLRVYGGVGSGLYRTTNGGKSWQRLGGGLPAVSPNVGRIGVAVAPSRPDIVYAIVIRTDGAFDDFYTSLDGGETWDASPLDVTLDVTQSSFGWWFGRLWVDPVDPLRVFAAGVFLAESVDGGTTWGLLQAGNIHPDQHAMTWHPVLPNVVYLGNDGGVYRSVTFGSGDVTWIPALEQPFVQFYGVDVSEQDPTRIVGGAQDNGSLRNWGLPKSQECVTWSNCLQWNVYYGGDGERNLINPKDQDNVFACYQYGNCARSEDGGETMRNFTSATRSSRRNWFSPLEFDPKNPDVMYYAGDLVNRSTDNGVTWEVISPDLTGGTGRDRQYPYGTITTIAPAATKSSVIYVGTDDGRLWRTSDTGKHWTRLKDPKLPTRWVTRVTVDPRDEDVVYVTFSGYRSGNGDPSVVMSRDGGRSWRNITGNLPHAPTNDVILAGNKVIVATDVGVFELVGDRWRSIGRGLPIVPVTDVRYVEQEGLLFAATFGRGIYSVEL